MIILQAKFTGKDSLGFKSGEKYNLSLSCYGSSFGSRSLQFGPISIETNAGTFPNYKKLRCEYSKLDKFFENWQVDKINHYDTSNTAISGEHDSSEFKSLLYSNMRESKIRLLV